MRDLLEKDALLQAAMEQATETMEAYIRWDSEMAKERLETLKATLLMLEVFHTNSVNEKGYKMLKLFIRMMDRRMMKPIPLIL